MSTPDDLNELEKQIAGLPVREPSQMLDARVAAALGEQTRPVMPWLALAAVVLIAGAVTLAVVFNAPGPVSTENPPVANETDAPPAAPADDASPRMAADQPTEALDLTWTRDVVDVTRYTPAGEPYRAVIREAVDHKAWANPETGETLQFRTPREELILIKQAAF